MVPEASPSFAVWALTSATWPLYKRALQRLGLQPPVSRPPYGLLRVRLEDGKLPHVLAGCALYRAGSAGIVLHAIGMEEAGEMAGPFDALCQVLGVVPVGFPGSKGEHATLTAMGFDKTLTAVTR